MVSLKNWGLAGSYGVFKSFYLLLCVVSLYGQPIRYIGVNNMLLIMLWYQLAWLLFDNLSMVVWWDVVCPTGRPDPIFHFSPHNALNQFKVSVNRILPRYPERAILWHLIIFLPLVWRTNSQSKCAIGSGGKYGMLRKIAIKRYQQPWRPHMISK